MAKQKKLVELSTLVEWNKNPRTIDEEQMQRLKEQLVRLGQYKPSVIIRDGAYNVVIGGNMRTKAMRELVEEGHEQFKMVWVSDLELKKEKGKFAIYIDGERAGFDVEGNPMLFESEEQAMTEYALSDNDAAGEYNQKMLGEHLDKLAGIPHELYHVSIDQSVDLSYIEDQYRTDALSVSEGGRKTEILTVLPPEAPKLKERTAIHFDDIKDYKKVQKAIEEGRLTPEKILAAI